MEKSWNCVFEFLWEPCPLKAHAGEGSGSVDRSSDLGLKGC